MPRSCRRRAVVAALLLAGLMAACGDGSDGASSSGGTGGEEPSGTVTVLAAASLGHALEEIGARFEADHPQVDVALSVDGSARLAAQIVEGAPADVFASADEANMTTVQEAGRAAGRPVQIATNELQIVVPAGNPLEIGGLADLAGATRLALCLPEVPCGSYAATAFRRAGLVAPPAGEEENVTAVLAKVQLGEADAGIVYVTDVRGATGVEGIDLAPGQGVTATYPACVLTDAPNPVAAAAFLDFLTGPEAKAILQARGFGLP